VGFTLGKENLSESIPYVLPSEVRMGNAGTEFVLEGEKVESSLIGEANLSNMLATAALSRAFGIPTRTVAKALSEAHAVPGRFEIVVRDPFLVIVDYAHTPDALEALYLTVRELFLKERGKLIGVLGAAGGGRDKWKRPEFGRIAQKFLDRAFLTNEDPYDEEPHSILQEIEAGMEDVPRELVIERREAISKALRSAAAGDAVVISGKGAEQMIMTKEGRVPWDDRKVVREEMSRTTPT
jgi:UDP-N-acetylmuramyl tripeptide synthase